MFLNRMRVGFLSLALAALAACFCTASLHAQSTTQGAIGGTVEDPTGAVIGNANVTIRNDGTNATIQVTADGSGYFKAPLVEPGMYTVTVDAQGFAKYTANNVVVVVGQLTSLMPQLALSSSTTQVVVTEQTPAINYESPDFTATLSSVALQNIPINNRRWSALAMTTPGVVADSSGFGLISVRGISTLLNNVEIDGADDNQAYYSEERGRTREAYSTSGSAVREFAVNTGVYSAEYGRAAGGVVTSVTRSGTNGVHGQAYFWDRESNWNAYNNYTKLTTLVNGSSVTSHIKPEDIRKIYGFTVGGPIIKDKLFWIYTYDQHSHIFPAIATPSIPLTFFTEPDAAIPTGGTCTTAGVVTGITPSAIDSQVCTMAARLGMTYAAGVTYYDSGLSDLTTDLGYIPRTGYQEINTPKIDWQVNPKEHVSVLYHRLRWDSPGGVQTQNPVFYGIDTTGTDFVKLDYGVTKLTSLISANISNELLYQYGRELNDEGQTPYSNYTKNNMVGAGGNVPEVVFSSSAGSLTFGSPYYSYRKALPDERKWQIGDVLYYNHGSNTFKFGVDVLHNSDLINNTFDNEGVYTYNYISNYLTDLYLSKNSKSPVCNSSASQSGTATAPVAGQPNDTYPCYSGFVEGFGNPVFGINTLDYGVFVQDNWKFSPRLTFEFGVRYDQELLPNEKTAYINAAVPQTANHPTDSNNFGPRVGFAWDTFGRGNTVVRGGFGMYYGRLPNGVLLNAQLNTAAGPAQYTTSYKPAATSAVPAGPQFPNIFAAGPAPVSPAVEYLDKNLQDPMVEEFDLVIQQNLGRGTVFSASYLGALGKELTNFLDTNLNPATTNVTITVSDSTGKGPLGPNGTTFTVPTFTSYITPGTTFGAITDVISNINSNYNAFVAEVQNHSLKSVQFDGSYTWAHALDYNQNSTTTTSSTNWLNPYASARSNYGNSSFNIPNRFVAWASYTAPRFVKGSSWAGYLANGWGVDDSFQAGNGLPLSVTPSGFNSTAALLTGWNGGGDAQYIPNIGRNTFTYPRHIVDDVRVQKSIEFNERYHLDLLCNVFNIANHQNIDGINTTGYTFTGGTANSSTATYQTSLKTVSSSNSSGFLFTPRQIEIAAKFNF